MFTKIIYKLQLQKNKEKKETKKIEEEVPNG